METLYKVCLELVFVFLNCLLSSIFFSQAFIVNAPWAFTGVWAFIKPFLNPNTVAKIKILSSGEKMFTEVTDTLGPDCTLLREMLMGDAAPYRSASMRTAHQSCQARGGQRRGE